MEKQTALITGASSGIGMEFARIFAENGTNLVIVARSLDKLKKLGDELEKEFEIDVLVIEKDLSKKGAASEIYESVKSENIQIDYLINNAGFGDYGHFAKADQKKIEDMINLNVTTLTMLTRLFLPEILERDSGKIVNVASIVSFFPGPNMANYFATKAFVLSLTEGISEEISSSNVTITALCPGVTASGFQKVANLEESGFVKGKSLPTSREVAEFGYKSMMKGKVIAVHGFGNRLNIFSFRFLPRSVVRKIIGRFSK